MKIAKFCLFFLLTASINLFGAQKTLFLPPPPIAGMFVSMNYVLGALYHYEKGLIKGVKVDFKEEGVYFDPQVGPNWWSYYFNPVEVGEIDEENPANYNATQLNELAVFSLKKLSREDANQLIKKYIHIKPHVINKVNAFSLRHRFRNSYLVGIHYRGTDKYKEIARTPYAKAMQTIDETLRQVKNLNYKIFVCSDEQQFVDQIKAKYGARVIHTDSIRSTDRSPVHFRTDEHIYRVGEEALIDCLLLSRCNMLIRTPSSFASAIEQFNPKMKVVRIGNWQ